MYYSVYIKATTKKEEEKKGVTSEILSQDCTYLAVYIKLDPTHVRHSNISAREFKSLRHLVISAPSQIGT
jgi:hypothetical protein